MREYQHGDLPQSIGIPSHGNQHNATVVAMLDNIPNINVVN